MDYFDVNKDMAFPSLASVAYRAINEKELISEEMRLIYVALTRAKEQLILVGRVKDEKSLIKYEQLAVSDTHIAVNERLTNPFVLIYGVLAKHQSPSLLNDQRFERDIDQLNSEVKPRVSIVIDHYEDVSTEEVVNDNEIRTIEELKAINTGNEDVKIKIHQQLSYDYPFKVNTMKPSKQSVSELKRQLETEESNTNYDRVRQYRIGVASYEKTQVSYPNKKRK